MENIINLKSGNYEAKVNLSRGANLISLTNSKYNADILRTPDYSKLHNPYTYGMPLLFPINRISKGEFVFQGRLYRFPVNEPATGCHLHGFLHDAEFVTEEVRENYIKCSCDIAQTEDFPHSIKVIMEYTLSDDGVEQKITICNLSDYDMPSLLGFHTTFNVPFIKDSSVDNVFVKCGVSDYIERGQNYLPTGNIPKADDITEALCKGTFKTASNPISRHYRADDNGEIALLDTKKNVTLVYETDKKFNFRLIYNGDGSEFICLEPQNCMVDAINSSFDDELSKIDVIEAKSKEEYVSKLYITKKGQSL